MRIGFDARMTSHPGIGRYIKNLLNAMIELGSKHEFILFGDRTKLTTYNLFPSAKALGEGQLKTAAIIHWNPPVYSLKEQLNWPFSRYNLDIIHIPHFNVPLGVGNGKERLIVTIHDLIYTKFPEYLPFLKRKIARYLIGKAVKKSTAIIAVSENTKNDIAEIFPIANQKTKVIYEAADPVFEVIDDEIYLEKIKKKYSLPEKIILFVGSLKRHKNIERLLDAYSRVKRRTPCSLVIIGRYHKQDAEILRKIRSSDIIYLGEIPAEDLVALYNLAKLLALPSLCEGFGLPVLEAFACGLPVAASNISSLPEVVGDGGVLFDPYDIDDICDKIYSILSDEIFRQSLIEKGLKRAREFSWGRTAVETLNVYENAKNKA